MQDGRFGVNQVAPLVKTHCVAVAINGHMLYWLAKTDGADGEFIKANRHPSGGNCFVLTTPSGSLEVERSSPHQGRWIVAFVGVSDRNQAEAMRGTGIVRQLSVMGVTAEGAEAAEDSPTVHVPLLVQSSASSASSAVNFCCS